MKKVFILMCLAVGLLSCAKEIAPQEETKGVPMTFEFSVDGQTKASKTAWTDIDVIYVFFKGLETKHLMLTYDSATQKWTPSVLPGDASLTDEDFDGLTEHTLTAVYLPTPVYVTTDTPGQFTITCDGEKPFYGFYLFQEGQAYEIDGTTVKAGLSLEKPADFVQIHIPCDPTEVGGTFGCRLIRPVACAGVGVDGKVVEKELQAGARLNAISDADGLLFAGRLTSPGTAADYTFTFATDAEIYTLLRDSKTLEPGKQYNFPALTTIGPDDWNKTAAEDLYVDLGLSVKWAKCNLGAATETDYGDYFAWGETIGYNEGKTDFVWSTYLFDNSASHDGSSFSKYTGSDFDTLKPEDDAAYAALGGKFRMPTSAEIDILRGLRKEWVNNYNGSGIKGYKFTGSNGNTLFLPAAGYRDGTNLVVAGSIGYYWSSSLYGGSLKYAWHLLFITGGGCDTEGNSRYCGCPVRPVYSD